MNNNKQKGLFIVFEGLDGCGKTSTINGVTSELKGNHQIYYCKCIGSDTWIGRLARKHPSTALFSLELLWQTLLRIKPQLHKNKIVLEDRYIFSITSYAPSMKKLINKIIVILIKPFIAKPDLIIYLDVSLDERLRRLKEDLDNPYHKILVDDSGLIIQREKSYTEVLAPYNDRLIRLNTTKNSVDLITNEALLHIFNLISKKYGHKQKF